MSELRAPDPTLAVLPDDMLLPVVTYERTEAGSYQPMRSKIVHRYGEGTSHFVDPNLNREPVMHLRYVAVPCRECFPDAPPPGHVWSTYVMGRQADVKPYAREVPHLAWQVITVTVAGR